MVCVSFIVQLVPAYVVQINVLAAVAVLIYIPLLLATNNTAGGHVGRIHGGERRRDVG